MFLNKGTVNVYRLILIYSRTSMARQIWNHENVIEIGAVCHNRDIFDFLYHKGMFVFS